MTRIFQADSRWNFILALPTLRIFFRVPTFRDLVVALIVIVPRFTAMFVLIFLVFYFYAVYGVLFFSSTWPILGSVAPKANFDTLSDAFLALAQIMIGEAWEEIMYAAMMATKVLYPAWFFISFVFIVTLLLTNAIVGMILTTTDSIVRSQRTRGKLNSDDIRELLLEN